MASRLNPYLNFNGSARQALDFYRSVFGGNLTLSTFAEFGMTDAPDADKIMHGQLETDAGYTIMAADVPSHMEYQAPAGFSVSLSGEPPAATRPCLASSVFTSARPRIAFISPFSFCTISGGVAAGAKSAYHTSASTLV